MHPDNLKEDARTRFEKQHESPREISINLSLPISTIYYWVTNEGWTRREESPESIALNELKGLIKKTGYTKDDLKKIKALRVILGEYACARSELTKELSKTIVTHRMNTTKGKKDLLNDLIDLLNRHTGSELKSVRSAKGTIAANDFRGFANAE